MDREVPVLRWRRNEIELLPDQLILRPLLLRERFATPIRHRG